MCTRFGRTGAAGHMGQFTPKHHESDTHVHRGRITKQGLPAGPWAGVESVQVLPKTSRIQQTRGRARMRIAPHRTYEILQE
jgi:hypothetical protein